MKESFSGVVRAMRGKRPRLVIEDERGRRVEISPRQGITVLPGDRVKAELHSPAWARHRRRRRPIQEANVVAVLERGAKNLVGRYHASRQRAWVVPREAALVEPVQVELRPDIAENSVVAVALDTGRGALRGKVAAVWADDDSPTSEIEQLIYERDLPREFPAAVMREIERLPEEIRREDAAGRLDLRGLKILVIDPVDAKDHDDGVSLEKLPGGGVKLGVHIADVSHYVTPGSPVDEEARARGVSVYLTDRVLPMLPPALSSNLCSLLEGKDRLARSVFIEYDAAGRFQRAEMHSTVIRPAANMSYEEARAILEDDKSRSPHAQALKAMNQLARKLRSDRFARGSLDFHFPEIDIVLDERGEPKEIKSRVSDESHWLIEEFMIAANRLTGTELARKGTGIWRIHEPPSMEQVKELEEFLAGLGVKLRRGTKSKDLHPKDFQALLDRFRGKPEEYAVHRRVLTSLSLAVYSSRNLGHFGLALDNYTHFTSPIRRYADLIVHRLTDPKEGAGKSGRYNPRKLEEISAQTSKLERRAQEAEWSCNKRMVLRYLGARLGMKLWGTVSKLEKFGAFVDLDGMDVGGLLPLEELGGRRFRISADGMSMRGGGVGRTFRVGERLEVVVAKVDRVRERLDLALAE